MADSRLPCTPAETVPSISIQQPGWGDVSSPPDDEGGGVLRRSQQEMRGAEMRASRIVAAACDHEILATRQMLSLDLFLEKIDRIVGSAKSISWARCCNSPPLVGDVLAHLEKPLF